MTSTQWKVSTPSDVPLWFREFIQEYTLESQGRYLAQLLWQRGIRDRCLLLGFLDANAYQPVNPFAFGQEMKWAVKRLQKAGKKRDKITIWGDFDADGITATSVLWEGLGKFFPQHLQLNYYIPHRFRESHGLNCSGIEQLAQEGTKLIVTCDTGSSNLKEIQLANQLGIDLIITDHHTLPEDRPPVVSIINPRYFSETHPLYHLAGVAVAYKLVEALYITLADISQNPQENLLDLVAIGLIADLVELSGDCRYLAQKGIEKLQQQINNPTRPGVALLLELCQRTGDRPTDISYGLGPRINAVSRIHGDASFCVELLTSKDRQRCQKLANETELANTRRKALQKDVTDQVKKKLAYLDLSTTSVIVLEDSQWQSGVLGLVAGQIALEYGRPVILLTTTEEETLITNPQDENISCKLARGSARSVNNIDLYELVASQSHLLHRFGGHPFAAGLSLPVENISLFREGINQQLRQQHGEINVINPILEADLIVTVAELGRSLFRELKLLEPCGMGNPVPRLLIQNCWFTDPWHNNSQDLQGKQVQYIKSTFNLWDDSVDEGFPGVWWGHYKDELPTHIRCDVIVELDFNASKNFNSHKTRYQVRLIAVRPHEIDTQISPNCEPIDVLLDWRNQTIDPSDNHVHLLQYCPHNWAELQREYRQAIAFDSKLALAYPQPKNPTPQQLWLQLVGIAKYLSRTKQPVICSQLQAKLGLSDYTLLLGLDALACVGFNYRKHEDIVYISRFESLERKKTAKISQFLAATQEEQFKQQYFAEIPLSVVQGVLNNLCF
jgi:single-stranded-DNA-specific exonuclease